MAGRRCGQTGPWARYNHRPARSAVGHCPSLWRERLEPFAPGRSKDVLFLFDTPGPWARYRCDHQAEQLQHLGVTSDVVQTARVELPAVLDHYDRFVLNRVKVVRGSR